jgi:hypothetical protein
LEALMILVSGTGRSGTSMWMQLFIKAGLPWVGEQFPLDWKEHLSSANSNGFFESSLANGINFYTNPDPVTGACLSEEEDWVVKVFSFGLRRTERRFLNRVLLSIRHWRNFDASLSRMQAMGALPASHISGPIWWFLEHCAVLEDALLRGYLPIRVGYEQTLQNPYTTLQAVFQAFELELPADLASSVKPSSLIAPAMEEPEAMLLDQLYQRMLEPQPISYQELAPFLSERARLLSARP